MAENSLLQSSVSFHERLVDRGCVFLRLPTLAAEILFRVRLHGVREGEARLASAVVVRRLEGVDGSVGAAETRAQRTRLLEEGGKNETGGKRNASALSDYRARLKSWSPGCVNTACKARLKWEARLVTKPENRLIAKPCTLHFRVF